jgi:hypothetical protein
MDIVYECNLEALIHQWNVDHFTAFGCRCLMCKIQCFVPRDTYTASRESVAIHVNSKIKLRIMVLKCRPSTWQTMAHSKRS